MQQNIMWFMLTYSGYACYFDSERQIILDQMFTTVNIINSEDSNNSQVQYSIMDILQILNS